MRKYGKTKDNPSLGDCQSAWAACKRETLKIIEANREVYLQALSDGVIEQIKKL